MFYQWCLDDSGNMHRSLGYLASMLILTQISSAFGSISTTVRVSVRVIQVAILSCKL